MICIIDSQSLTEAGESARESGGELGEGEGCDGGVMDGEILRGRDEEQSPLSLLSTHNCLWVAKHI